MLAVTASLMEAINLSAKPTSAGLRKVALLTLQQTIEHGDMDNRIPSITT